MLICTRMLVFSKCLKSLYMSIHYKKICFSPLAVRYMYGHCTRGELFATCKWPRKYTWWIRVTLTAQLVTCILIHAATWPRVLKYARPIVRHVINTCGHMFATCILDVANIAAYILIHVAKWPRVLIIHVSNWTRV
jgi:hypothetical protein